jgi:hypothetical protein
MLFSIHFQGLIQAGKSGDLMTNAISLQESMELRIARLEKQNSIFKRVAVGMLLPIACLLLMGQAKKRPAKPTPPSPSTPTPAAVPETPKSISAENFILKDSNGKVRAELTLDGSGPSLKLRNQAGVALVTLALNDGAPGGPLLLMSDALHHSSMTFSVLEGNGSQLSLIGARPDVQLRLGVTPDGTSLELSDKDGFATSIGSGVVAEKNGKVKKATAASLVLYGKDRKVLWSQP